MVSTREAGTAFHLQPVEILSREPNSFLRFTEANNGLFTNYSSLTHELRDMEEGWKTSPAIDHFVEETVDIVFSASHSLGRGNKSIDKVIAKIRDIITNAVFSKSGQKDIQDKYGPLMFSALPHLTAEMKESLETLQDEMDEFTTSFQEEREAITGPLRKSKMELMEKFRGFLLSDPLGIFMFQEFLESKESGRRKEEIRPFLSSLIEEEERMHKDGEVGSLSQAVKKWTNEIKEHPTDIFIDEFVASIKDSNILEWLKFAAADTKDLDGFLKSRPVATWPSQLKSLLNSFIGSKYQSAHAEIRRQLDPFRKPLSLKAINQGLRVFEEQAEQAGQAAEVIPKGKTVPHEKVSEKGEREKHPVGILSKEVGKPNYLRFLKQEEVEEFLRKKSDALASSDPRMLEDLKNMIRDLSESPYGPGTKKLHDMNFHIGTNQIWPLRSYNPGKRMGLHLEHPDSKSIRIVFTRSENPNGLAFVGIERIYTHDEYEKKFT